MTTTAATETVATDLTITPPVDTTTAETQTTSAKGTALTDLIGDGSALEMALIRVLQPPRRESPYRMFAGMFEAFSQLIGGLVQTLVQLVTTLVGLTQQNQKPVETPAPTPQPDLKPPVGNDGGTTPPPPGDNAGTGNAGGTGNSGNTGTVDGSTKQEDECKCDHKEPGVQVEQKPTEQEPQRLPADAKFLWKPEGRDGSLKIFLDGSLADKVKSVKLVDKNGKVIEEGVEPRPDEANRDFFDFKKPGGKYPDGVKVIIELDDGTKYQVVVKETSERFAK